MRFKWSVDRVVVGSCSIRFATGWLCCCSNVARRVRNSAARLLFELTLANFFSNNSALDWLLSYTKSPSLNVGIDLFVSTPLIFVIVFPTLPIFNVLSNVLQYSRQCCFFASLTTICAYALQLVVRLSVSEITCLLHPVLRLVSFFDGRCALVCPVWNRLPCWILGRLGVRNVLLCRL